MNESPSSYYERAQEYYSLIGNAAEEARVIRLASAMRKTEEDGWSIPRSAEYYIEKVRRARTFAMSYSCKRSFTKLRNTIAFHDKAMEGKELERYKLLGGWRSDGNWDEQLKAREEEVKKDTWKGGVPSQIKNNLKEIRERQKQILKEEEMEKAKKK